MKHKKELQLFLVIYVILSITYLVLSQLPGKTTEAVYQDKTVDSISLYVNFVCNIGNNTFLEYKNGTIVNFNDVIDNCVSIEELDIIIEGANNGSS